MPDDASFPTTLRDTITAIEDRLSGIADRRRELTDALDALDAERDALIDAVQGLLRTEAILEGPPTPAALSDDALAPFTGSEDQMWRLRNRQQAALEALHNLGGAAHIRDIATYLTKRGRDDTYQLVSAALSALSGKKLVQPVPDQRGVWSLTHLGTIARDSSMNEVLSGGPQRPPNAFTGRYFEGAVQGPTVEEVRDIPDS